MEVCTISEGDDAIMGEMEMEVDPRRRPEESYLDVSKDLLNKHSKTSSRRNDSSSSSSSRDASVDWEALKVVDTIEELQQRLRENRHCNLLVLPTGSTGSWLPPSGTIRNRSDGHQQRTTPTQSSATIAETATTTTAARLPFRQFVTPAIYCSMVADALQSNTALTSLTLEEVPLINSVSMASLYQPQPQMFRLGESIASHPHLKRLALVDNRLGDTGIITLMQAWSLLEASATSASSPSITRHGFRVASPLSLPLPLPPPAQKGSCLQSLSLCANQIGDQGAFWIAQAFLKPSTSSSLAELDLSSNLISNEGAVSLSNLIRKSKSLTTLFLSGNAIGPQGAESLAQALQENSQMNILGLSSNGIQDQGALAMAVAASQHPSLQALLLEDNRIGTQGCSAVVQAYQINPRLGMMELSGNHPLHLSVLPNIALAMSTIRYLYLDRCGLQDSHAQYLAKSLRTNNTTTVQELFLDGNQIGLAGAIELARALETNTTLEGLFLEGNPIEIAGARALCETLKTSNMTLRRLAIGPIGPVETQNEAMPLDDADSTTIALLHKNNDYRAIQQEIEVYLDMNASGRKRVLQSELPPALWSYFLQRDEITFDPSMMFLFHKEHPQLFFPQPA
jgi:Ran GTPase-activating protein (RanGAP) involved in mRNA processing and transport